MFDIKRIINNKTFTKINTTTIACLSISGLLLSSSTFADSKATYKTNDLGPFAAFSTFTSLDKYTFFLGELEAGAKHQKLGTTFTTFVGWNKEHGFKATLQYTRQKPQVNFFDKSRDVWVQQGAIGLEYLYVQSNLIQFNASSYYGFIPSTSVTIKNSNSSVTLLTDGSTTINKTSEQEIGEIVEGNQFGGWVGVTYTPFKDTLFRAKIVCDYLKRDLQYDSYYDSNGDIQSRDNTISSCGAGATIAFPIYAGFSAKFDEKYNPELIWAPSFSDSTKFILGGKVEKTDYEDLSGGFNSYYLKMFYEF